MSPPPPLTASADLQRQLAAAGWAVLDAAALRAVAEQRSGRRPEGWSAWASFWNDLPADAYLRDGGRYRRRRHGSFVVQGASCEAVPHRAHWQPVEYNALHGGIERWFEPLPPALVADPAWAPLLLGGAAIADMLRGPQRWFVEAHPFRIDTTDGIGRPTPEGAHRDGVDFVVVVLVAREGVKGGETRVFEAQGPRGIRFTMTEPWTLLMLDDARVVHESTPIQPLPGVAAGQGHRDTLVLTFRSGGFLGPERA